MIDVVAQLGHFLRETQCLSCFTFQHTSAQNPWSACKPVIGGDLTAIDGKPESPRNYAEQYGSICQGHPGLRLLVSRTARNAMMAVECGDSLSRPAVPAPRKMTVAVQNASDKVIAANAMQNPNGFDQLP